MIKLKHLSSSALSYHHTAAPLLAVLCAIVSMEAPLKIAEIVITVPCNEAGYLKKKTTKKKLLSINTRRLIPTLGAGCGGSAAQAQCRCERPRQELADAAPRRRQQQGGALRRGLGAAAQQRQRVGPGGTHRAAPRRLQRTRRGGSLSDTR